MSEHANIIDVDNCPKCGGSDLDLKYDPTFDKINVTCETCGYTFVCACADSMGKATEDTK